MGERDKDRGERGPSGHMDGDIKERGERIVGAAPGEIE